MTFSLQELIRVLSRMALGVSRLGQLTDLLRGTDFEWNIRGCEGVKVNDRKE
jgi:hypothetical protein